MLHTCGSGKNGAPRSEPRWDDAGGGPMSGSKRGRQPRPELRRGGGQGVRRCFRPPPNVHRLTGRRGRTRRPWKPVYELWRCFVGAKLPPNPGRSTKKPKLHTLEVEKQVIQTHHFSVHSRGLLAMPRPGGLGVTARVHGSVACAWRVLGGASRILARDCGPRRSVLAGRRHFGAARGTVVGVAHAAESRAPRRPVQRAALHPPSAFFRQPGLGERRCCPLLVRVRRTMAAPSAACRRRRRYRASTCNPPCRAHQRLWRCRGRRTGHGR